MKLLLIHINKITPLNVLFLSSMVIVLDLLATRFPLDPLSDANVEFVSNNIAVYVVQIIDSDVVGKMCYVTSSGKGSTLKDINCLPCIYNNSCGKQMVGVAELLWRHGGLMVLVCWTLA